MFNSIENSHFDLAIIGAGPAGIMAAISAAKNWQQLQTETAGDKQVNKRKIKICLLEKNDRIGRKILLTGKGRCNLTNVHDLEEKIDLYGEGKQGRFLYPAFQTFTNFDLIDLVENLGLKTKIERGQRIFPVSNKALDVVDCLKQELIKQKVKIIYKFSVVKISQDQKIFRILSATKKVITAKKIMIATGGKSYPQTGSTGDGYQLAKSFGHSIVRPRPALASLFVRDEEIRSLAGLTLKNVSFAIYANGEKQMENFGEMLFTHQGVTGPIVMKTSKYVYDLFGQKKEVIAAIDLKPALSEEVLSKRLEREIDKLYKKEFHTLLKELLPKALIPLVIKQTELDKRRKNSSLSKNEIRKIIKTLKRFEFKIDGVAPIDFAIVTAGGINLKEINPKTMESKLVNGLYFAGETIDLDGPTGGYNLQMAFSTGFLAGSKAVESI